MRGRERGRSGGRGEERRRCGGSETKSDRTRKPVYTRRVATREMPDRSWPSSQGVGIYRVGRTHLATDAHHDAARPFLDRDPILCMYLATRRGKRREWEGGEISSEISKKKSLAAMAILFFFFFFGGTWLLARPLSTSSLRTTGAPEERVFTFIIPSQCRARPVSPLSSLSLHSYHSFSEEGSSPLVSRADQSADNDSRWKGMRVFNDF